MAFALATLLLSQLSPPPLFPAEEAPPPPPPPSAWGTRSLLTPPPEGPATAGQLIGRAMLAPLISFGLGILAVPLGAFAGFVVTPGSVIGGGIGAIAGGFAAYTLGTAIASTLFSREAKGLQRAVPWALGAAALSTVGFCLVVFVPAVSIFGLPWVILGAVALSAAVPLVVEATREVPPGPEPTLPVARF